MNTQNTRPSLPNGATYIPPLEAGARSPHQNDTGIHLVQLNKPADNPHNAPLTAAQEAWPIMICMLGDFRLLQYGRRVTLHSGGKLETLLCYLGLHYGSSVSRATLVNALWPSSDAALGAQSLNSLIYQLHKLTCQESDGAQLVIRDDGQYRLNVEAGVAVDISHFESLANKGDSFLRNDDHFAAVTTYAQAVAIYGGDLCVATDVHAILVRERLRSRYLTILAQIADYHYRVNDFATCLGVAWRLLEEDPCREDAHRLVMRCYVKRGERAAALRHYHTCAEILGVEIEADPEPATQALLEQIRRRPDLI